MKIFSLLILILAVNCYARPPIEANRFEALSGISAEKRTTFNNENEDLLLYPEQMKPSSFLVQNIKYIQKNGRVLDLTMRNGSNAIFLATKGHQVSGIESNEELNKKALRRAKDFGVSLEVITANIVELSFDNNSFDGIINFDASDDAILPKVASWIKPGAVLFYETEKIKKENARIVLEKISKLLPNMQLIKFEAPHRSNNFKLSAIFTKL